MFRPKLFMQAETFKARLDYLINKGYNVCTLDEGLALLQQGGLPNKSVVITMDDGWLGSYLIAHPMLKKRELPWTLYLTSYYAAHRVQVVNIAIQYLLWKTHVEELKLNSLIPGEDNPVACKSESDKKLLATQLNHYCDQLETVAERQQFVNQLALLLDVDWAPYVQEGVFRLITAEQCRALAADGVAIELHTHRHTLPDASEQAMLDELSENAEWIVKNVGSRPQHFCYPSGLYNPAQLQWLGQTELLSATTCNPGLNTKDTPVFELKRFLDGENIHQIEFEAEISGFKTLLRRLLG